MERLKIVWNYDIHLPLGTLIIPPFRERCPNRERVLAYSLHRLISTFCVPMEELDEATTPWWMPPPNHQLLTTQMTLFFAVKRFCCYIASTTIYARTLPPGCTKARNLVDLLMLT